MAHVKEERDDKNGQIVKTTRFDMLEYESDLKVLKGEMSSMYENFTKGGKESILSGEDLDDTVTGSSMPASLLNFLSGGNMTKYVFISYAWEQLLKKHFLNSRAGDSKWKERVKMFAFVMMNTDEKVFDLEFTMLARMCENYNMEDLKAAPMYEIPAILRLLAPLEGKICGETNLDKVKAWYFSLVRGLSLETILCPWESFNMEQKTSAIFPEGKKSVRKTLLC